MQWIWHAFTGCACIMSHSALHGARNVSVLHATFDLSHILDCCRTQRLHARTQRRCTIIIMIIKTFMKMQECAIVCMIIGFKL